MMDQGRQSAADSPRTEHGTEAPSAETIKQQGQDAAHEVGEAAQHQAESYFNQQRDNAAEQSHKLTGVLQKMADEFDQQQQPYFSKQARKFAEATERFSNNVRDKDLHSVCHEAQSFSRREPALFLGGVITAGFLVSRFLRSSAHHSAEQPSNGQPPGKNSSAQFSADQSSSVQHTPGANTPDNQSSSANLSADGRPHSGSESL